MSTSNQRNIAGIRFSGDWRDAWLYKEHMILWSREGQTYIIPVAEVLRYIRSVTTPAAALALEYLLFRNDWKISEQFQRILSVEGMNRQFCAGLNEIAKTTLGIPSEIATRLETEQCPGILLDAEIYANRVYLASTEGLFETYFNPSSPFNNEPLVNRLTCRAREVKAKYAAVNVAAGDEGLLFAPVLFGDERWWADEEANQFQQIAEYSLSASFSSRNLLNYTDAAIPVLFRGEATRERLHPAANYESWRVTSYDTPTDISELTRQALNSRVRIPLSQVKSTSVEPSDQIIALGNYDYRLIVALDQSLTIVNLSDFEGIGIAAKTAHRYSFTEDSIRPEIDFLATYPIAGGFLAELFDRILLIMPTGIQLFFEGRAARVRTFTNSRRYQDTAMIIEEDGLSLIGYF